MSSQSPEPFLDAPLQEQFVSLLTASHNSIYGFIVSLVGDRTVADDLMQEISLLLWRKFQTFDLSTEDRSEKFLKWALVSARNLVRNYYRQKKSHSVVFDDELISKMSATHQGVGELLEIRREALRLCLQKLTPADRQLLQLCYGQSATMKEAAVHLGKSSEAIYMAVSRLRHRLFRCINRTLGLMK